MPMDQYANVCLHAFEASFNLKGMTLDSGGRHDDTLLKGKKMKEDGLPRPPPSLFPNPLALSARRA